MQYEDLIERVGWGEEFLFEYHGEKYWISQNPNGRYLTRESDGYSQEFKTTYELFLRKDIPSKEAVIEDFNQLILPWWELEANEFVTDGEIKEMTIYIAS